MTGMSYPDERKGCTSALRGAGSGEGEEHTAVWAAGEMVVSASLSEPAACCQPWHWQGKTGRLLESSPGRLLGGHGVCARP